MNVCADAVCGGKSVCVCMYWCLCSSVWGRGMCERVCRCVCGVGSLCMFVCVQTHVWSICVSMRECLIIVSTWLCIDLFVCLNKTLVDFCVMSLSKCGLQKQVVHDVAVVRPPRVGQEARAEDDQRRATGVVAAVRQHALERLYYLPE